MIYSRALGMFVQIFIIWMVCQSAEAQDYLRSERFGAFLSNIEGTWKGSATKTPVGPRLYDITFTRKATNQVEGEAHPGSEATHYWTFYEENKILKLRFLSTFAGNRQPIYLTANAEKEGSLIFNTDDLQYLEVRVLPRRRTLNIQIFIRGEHHVEIQLARPD